MAADSSTLPSLRARLVTVCCSTSHVGASASRRVWGRLRGLHSHAALRNAKKEGVQHCVVVSCPREVLSASYPCLLERFTWSVSCVRVCLPCCLAKAVVGRAGPWLWHRCVCASTKLTPACLQSAPCNSGVAGQVVPDTRTCFVCLLCALQSSPVLCVPVS